MEFKSTSIPTPSEGVIFNEKDDMVIPDQGLSLKEILERFTRGETLELGKQTWYEPDLDEDSESLIDYDKLRGLDLTELEAMKTQIAELIASQTGKIENFTSSPQKDLDNNMRTDTDVTIK